MSARRYDVLLADTCVGVLTANDDGLVSFRFDDAYIEQPSRLVLGQAFEDDLSKTYSGNAPGALPGFFANLLPEGALRGVLERSLGDAGDDVSFLAALGDDLPGAVRVRPSEAPPGPARAVAEPSGAGTEAEREGLRFSLAGVQLKFSMLEQGHHLTLPAHGAHGDWIVKLGTAPYAHLVENEYATMEWARACGFDVPECRLHRPDALIGLPRQHALDDSPVLAVRRYDRREGGAPIHQEDFAQVMDKTRPPRSNGRFKYDSKMEAIAVLVKTIVGDEAYFELVRRLAFVIASGNFDAHLKNWSLTYPDGRTPRLSPLYDQVCTVVWPQHDRELALKLAGTRHPSQVDASRLRFLAKKVGASEDETVAAAATTIARARETFETAMAPHMPDEQQRRELTKHWQRVPLLRDAGPL